MCGLVGIAGDTAGAWKDVYSELLLFDVVRGPHSTGAGFVNRHTDEFRLVKRPGNPFNVFATKEFDAAMDGNKNPTKVLFGHNRYATIGEKTEENAHPFAFEHVMGMHNGTLEKWSFKDLPFFQKYGTDSETIFAGFNTIGVPETMAKMYGAWALIWYDRRTKELNFLRNDRRPLHYCYSEDRCTLIWASESDMLKYVMNRNRKKIAGDEIFITAKDTRYRWKVPSVSNKKFDSPEQSPQEGKTWAGVTTVWNHGTASFTTGSTSTGATATKHVSSKHQESLTPFDQRPRSKKFRPPYKDMHGFVLTKPQFLKMTANGCAFCEKPNQKWMDFVQIMGTYTGDHTAYACEECYNEAEPYEVIQYAL